MASLIKYLALIIMLFFISPLKADIVDVWQFTNEENELRAVALAKQLRCPQCQNQNLVESTSPIARDLRREVYQLVDEGKSDADIMDIMTDRFGDFVLYKPKFNVRTLLLWLAPFLMLILAAFMCWKYISARSQNVDLSADQQRRLQRLLAQQSAQDI